MPAWDGVARIERFYPDSRGAAQPYLHFLEQVARRTARLFAQWQGVGFCHGVLNTDNMSILGLTIDYGPFGFMDAFDAGYICNHSDSHGRYAYNMQPQIAHWNLYALGQSLVPLTDDMEATKAAIDTFVDEYAIAIDAVFRAKLGLATQHAADEALINGLIDLLNANRTDWPRFWRRLSQLRVEPTPGQDAVVRDLVVVRGAEAMAPRELLPLRVAELLADLKLPAALAHGVVQYATWDLIMGVQMADIDDWLALTRSAQALGGDQFADYVSALTADGPLVFVK